MTIKTATQAFAAPAGVHGAGGGLYLRKTSGERGAGSWIYRYRLGGKRREMGLGPLAALSLAEAKDRAGELARQRNKGADPIEARRKEKADAAAQAQADKARATKAATFAQATMSYLKAHAPSWKHRRADKDWLNPIVKFAFPIIGDMALNDIGIEHVAAILSAASAAHAPEMGRRVRARVEAILNAAIALGQRDPMRGNPANGKLIAAVHPLKRNRGERPHYRRIGLDAAPAAFRELARRAEGDERFGAWAFMIATAARPGEALGARWGEIDLDKKLWTIPAARMKGGRAHTVPLSSIALAVLERQLRVRTGDTVFAGRGGGALGHSTLSAPPRGRGLDVGSPHSWRSVFRDACGDRLRVNGHRIDRDLAEAALAHSLGAVEGAYRRETAVEDRRPVMESYARWLEGEGANVVAFPARA
jgi:integrase